MYLLRAPTDALAPFIESYWFLSSEHGPVDLRVDVFVDGRADLIFNYGAPYLRQVGHGAAVAHAASNLDAQRLTPIRIIQRGAVRVVGVRFRLGGVGPFARCDLWRHTGGTPAPVMVFGPAIGALEAELDALGPDAAAARLDAFFVDNLRLGAGRPAFDRALVAMGASQGGTSIEAIAGAAGTSQRHLERLFARQVGLTPKTVARVLRFQAALRTLMRDPGVPLTQVAADLGYFDQAHFIRDFRAMTGGVPRGYRGYFPVEGPTDFAPNVVAFVQDDGGGEPAPS